MTISITRAGECAALRIGHLSLLFSRREAITLLCLSLLLVLSGGIAIMAGSTWLSPLQLFHAVNGTGSQDIALLVREFRPPRILIGVLAGAALGIAGCLSQALTRNRLASPDVLGCTDGAAGAVLLALVVSPAGLLGPWWTGPTGAAVAVLVLVLVTGRIGKRGQRILAAGIGLAALWRALVELALSRLDLSHAGSLLVWRNGSLSSLDYASAVPLAASMLILIPVALYYARKLALLHFDPDITRSLGAPLATMQSLALLIAVGLFGLAIGICGPIAFAAFAAPYIAARTTGKELALIASGLTGALLVVAADTLARTVLPSNELPAGVICSLLGGLFLMWLLYTNPQGTSS